jgi:rhodanese-related sulfurtransferase
MQQIHAADLPEFLRQQAAEEPAREIVLLDVREPWEVQTARLDLPGVRLAAIPMNQLPQRLAELAPEQLILGLCHHGMRSLQCVAFLARQGFERVYNVGGGIDAWSREVDPGIPRY